MNPESNTPAQTRKLTCTEFCRMFLDRLRLSGTDFQRKWGNWPAYHEMEPLLHAALESEEPTKPFVVTHKTLVLTHVWALVLAHSEEEAIKLVRQRLRKEVQYPYLAELNLEAKDLSNDKAAVVSFVLDPYPMV